MWTVVVLAVVTLLASFVFLFKPLRKDGGLALALVLPVLFAIVGGFVGVLGTLVISNFPEKQWEREGEIRLVSMRSVDAVRGSLFLGSGFIGTSQYYFYYADSGDGGYKPGKLYAGRGVTVYEEDRDDGVIEIYSTRFVDKKWYRWAQSTEDTYYKIRIPKGSLKKDFTLQ